MPGANVGMINIGEMLGKSMGTKEKKKKMTVKESHEILLNEEADKLIEEDFGISHEAFEAALKSLEESKRILIYRAARGIDDEYMDRGLLSFIRSSIVNTQVDDSEVDSRIMSDEEKVIEKLVIGDKFFAPIQSQEAFTRPSRSVETSFEGIFWAFALLAFAAVIMFLINNTK